MADNYQATAGSGLTFIADEVSSPDYGTGKVTYVKLMDGAVNGTGLGSFVNGFLPTTPQTQYLSSRSNLAVNATTPVLGDIVGNIYVNDQGQKSYQQDSMSTYAKGYKRLNLTASGQILSQPGILAGWMVNSITGTPTMQIGDSLTSGSGGNGYLGGPITLAVGVTVIPPTEMQVGAYANITLGGGAADITFFSRLGVGA